MPDRTLLGSVISQLKFTEDLPSSLVVKYLELTPRHYYGDARLQFGRSGISCCPEEQTITVNNGTNRVWLNRTFAAKSGYLQANSSEIVSLSILNIYACASG
uniref:Beta-galactosidase n=1 Tax=Macrostomum lignano TaxID=282301 RepID=A0A1I8G5R2_9PLAT